MPNAVVIYDTAIRLAEAGTPEDRALRELLDCCGERRVAVVVARQHLSQDVGARPDDPVAGRAAELLDRVLEHLPVE